MTGLPSWLSELAIPILWWLWLGPSLQSLEKWPLQGIQSTSFQIHTSPVSRKSYEVRGGLVPCGQLLSVPLVFLWRWGCCPSKPLLHFCDQVFKDVIVWKVAGLLVNPKNMTRGSKSPQFVWKAAFHLSPSFMWTLLKPQQTSSLVKYLAPWSLLTSLEMRGSVRGHPIPSQPLGHFL